MAAVEQMSAADSAGEEAADDFGVVRSVADHLDIVVLLGSSHVLSVEAVALAERTDFDWKLSYLPGSYSALMVH